MSKAYTKNNLWGSGGSGSDAVGSRLDTVKKATVVQVYSWMGVFDAANGANRQVYKIRKVGDIRGGAG